MAHNVVVAKRNVRRSAALDPAHPCPCGSGLPYGQCCRLRHRGEPAPTAELLMRSRYTAFVIQNGDYLLRTWHPATRPGRIQFDPDQHWLGLHVLRVIGGGLLDNGGSVEFQANFRTGVRPGVLREHSRFIRHHGLWVYLGPVPALA